MYTDTSLTVEERVEDLVSRMTLEEKISQMIYDAPAIERLGVPKYNWWNECLHGVGRSGVATAFPQAIGLAATWNPELVHQVATVIADEARAKHHQAARQGIREIYSGLTFWSPNINLVRDPRWGRGQETYGEDPFLTAEMGVAFVKGLQGDDPNHLKVVATPKHFAVHSGPEPLRHSFDVTVSEQDLREYYLPAFKACVTEARASSVMGAYNRVNGEPCCASPSLLEAILRQEWGFDGYIVSDCGAIRDIYMHHKVCESAAEAAALAVQHGCDLNCGRVYSALADAVDEGLLAEEAIDGAVKRLFTARFRLGMFDPPEQVPYTGIPYEVIHSAGHRDLALQAARESIVLLKNQEKLLPLSKDLTSIAVIGPNADDPGVLLGNYNGTPLRLTTPLEGIRSRLVPAAKVYYAEGCPVADGISILTPIPSTCLRPENPGSGRRGLTARYYDNARFAGEPVLSQVDREVDFIWKDTNPITGRWGDDFSIRWTGTLVPPMSGTYRIGVDGFRSYQLYLDGKLIVEGGNEHHPALNSVAVDLEAGLFYRLELAYLNQGLDPQVRLLWSLPETDYESTALEAAGKAEVIVAVLGLSPTLEGEEMPVNIEGFSGGDRTDIQLPAVQERLLKKLYALGKPVVLVLLNGSALAVNWAAEHVPAILEAWYPGQAAGEAIADVLFGDYNPAGRLPVTFYRSVDDLPPFEDYRVEGHTYRYFRGEPLFPFGYGLSYTTFQVDNLRLDRSSVALGDTVSVSVDVTNSGHLAGDEVVQFYVRQPGSRATKELAGFKRVSLLPGQCQTVTFTLDSGRLAEYDGARGLAVRPGVVELLVGHSSQHLPLKETIQIED